MTISLGSSALAMRGNRIPEWDTGVSGDDTLVGSAGDDTYQFGRGDGHDTADNIGSSDTTNDELHFGQDIAPEQLWFTQAGGDLNVRVVGSDDRVTLTDWYTEPSKRVDEIETADGQVLVEAKVQQLVDAMAAFAPPTGPDENLPQDILDDLQPTIAASWESS